MPFSLDETEPIDAPASGVRVAKVVLTVVEGPSRGRSAKVAGFDAATVRDLGSKNGRFVDGVRVRDADVRAGSVVRLGESAVRVDIEAAAARLPSRPARRSASCSARAWRCG